MRDVTPAEAERWTTLAAEHGFTDEAGDIAPGRFKVVGLDEQLVTLQVITPIVAGSYTETLEKKEPPIRFDRTAAGEIILPGRWWAHMFESLSDSADLSQDERTGAARLARFGRFTDVLLPPESETIGFVVPDENGNHVVHEAIPPETLLGVRVAKDA